MPRVLPVNVDRALLGLTYCTRSTGTDNTSRPKASSTPSNHNTRSTTVVLLVLAAASCSRLVVPVFPEGHLHSAAGNNAPCAAANLRLCGRSGASCPILYTTEHAIVGVHMHPHAISCTQRQDSTGQDRTGQDRHTHTHTLPRTHSVINYRDHRLEFTARTSICCHVA